MDPDLFFPPTGSSNERFEAPKLVCAKCPVTKECLDFALQANEEAGVWGGKSARERRKIKQDQRESSQI